ncbi:type 1 glutamine amidotransferase domain-containing protein [Hathewaya histolytica]|uniref:type 1 glutamine amidotransferase domain-containing protein n=1 Tax=Hathewaya histolytica TaxID=1498 RepID=UPI003B676062
MKKILIVETNISTYENINRATGLWLGETVHFYDEIIKAGYEVEFVSPKGGYVPIDPHSFKYAKNVDFKYYKDDDFKEKALTNTLKPSEINPDDYIAIYYTGGHGVIWDFPENKEIKNIAQIIYQNNGFVTAVCHGVVGLLDLVDKYDKPLVKGKTITGFSNLEEFLNRTNKKVPYSTEDELLKRKCIYKKKSPFT